MNITAAQQDALKSLLDSQHNLLRHAEAERDEISLRREESVMANEQMLADLTAAQQEARRLREALENANEKIRAFAKPAVQQLLAKMSAPAPVHTDMERLETIQRIVRDFVSRNPKYRSSEGVEQDPWGAHKLLAAIDAELAKEDK